MEGWIKLHRKIYDSVVWTDSDMLKLWTLCLFKASHKDRPKYPFAGKEIDLKAGEFITGRDALAAEFNNQVKKSKIVSSKTLWRWLKKFENMEMLSINSTSQYSVISILNWNEYQNVVQQVSNECPTDVQQVSTNKNVKNLKNNKSSSKRTKRIYEIDSPYLLLAEKLFKQICQNQEIKEPNLQNWADDIRKMIEIDKRTESKVSKMIDWATSDPFWSAVILSAKKLREKYDTMAAQANRDYKDKGPNRPTVDLDFEEQKRKVDAMYEQ